MTALSTGHLAVDFAGGAIPALLPFFKDRFGLSYTLAAVIVLASTVSSSVIQPLFGLWSDRRGAIWLLSAGVAVAGVGIGLAAFGLLNPLLAAFIHVASELTFILNSARLLPPRSRGEKQTTELVSGSSAAQART